MRTALAMAIVVGMGCLLAGALMESRHAAAPWLDSALRHLSAVSVLVALQASILVSRGRQRWHEFYAEGWLSGLPLKNAVRARMVAARSLAPVFLIWSLLVIAILTTLVFPSQRQTALIAVTLASLGGAGLGWFLPRRGRPDDRDPGVFRVLTHPREGAALAALSYWVMAQARTWTQPRTLARLMMPAMLVLPMELSGNVALALLVVWVLIVYLSALLRAMVNVTYAGAQWLRPTPLGVGRFAWAVSALPLMKQLQWTLVMAALLIGLGCKPLMAVRVAEWWLALVSLTSGLSIASACRGWRVAPRFVISLAALALAERLKAHLALPCALLISLWHLKRAARA
jgi:hypothetical protein